EAIDRSRDSHTLLHMLPAAGCPASRRTAGGPIGDQARARPARLSVTHQVRGGGANSAGLRGNRNETVDGRQGKAQRALNRMEIGGFRTNATEAELETVPEQVSLGLRLMLFGSFQAQVQGRPLPRLRSRRGEWLLALLTLRRCEAVP